MRIPERLERCERLSETLPRRVALVRGNHANHKRILRQPRILPCLSFISRPVRLRVNAMRHIQGVQSRILQHAFTKPGHSNRNRTRVMEKPKHRARGRLMIHRNPRRNIQARPHMRVKHPHIHQRDNHRIGATKHLNMIPNGIVAIPVRGSSRQNRNPVPRNHATLKAVERTNGQLVMLFESQRKQGGLRSVAGSSPRRVAVQHQFALTHTGAPYRWWTVTEDP